MNPVLFTRVIRETLVMALMLAQIVPAVSYAEAMVEAAPVPQGTSLIQKIDSNSDIAPVPLDVLAETKPESSEIDEYKEVSSVVETGTPSPERVLARQIEEGDSHSPQFTGSISAPRPEAPKPATDAHVVRGSVDQNTGAFTYSYPFVFPPARGNVTPSIDLSYNNQRVRTYNTLVVRGWSFGTAYIERTNVRGVDRLYTDNIFTSSAGGELVPILITTTGTTREYTSAVSADGFGVYGNRTETGDYTKYEFKNDNTWTVTGKDGVRTTYGAVGDSRESDPENTTDRVFRWYVTSVADSNGNTIQYEYSKFGNVVLPETISYPGTRILINYEDAHYARVNYASGFERIFGKRIAELVVTHDVNNTNDFRNIRKYAIHYNTSEQVTDIVESVWNNTNSSWAARPATSFGYNVSPKGWVLDSSYPNNIKSAEIPNGSWNSDAYPDTFAVQGAGNGNAQIIAQYISGSDIIEIPDWSTNNYILGWGDAHWDALVGTGTNQKGTLIDWNGDFVSDVWGSDYSGSGNTTLKALLNTGIATGFVYSDALSIENIDSFAGTTQTMDINGDGLLDVVCSEESAGAPWYPTNCNTQYNSSSTMYDLDRFMVHNGASFEDRDYKFPFNIYGSTDKRFSFGFYNSDGILSLTGLSSMDINADGLTDLVVLPSGNNYTAIPFGIINDGNAFTNRILAVNINQGATPIASPQYTRTADINSDGYLDFVCRSNKLTWKIGNQGQPDNKPCATTNNYAQIVTLHGLAKNQQNSSNYLITSNQSSQWLWPDRNLAEPLAVFNSQATEDPKELFQLTYGSTNSFSSAIDTGLSFVDINADGYPDLVRPILQVPYSGAMFPSRVYINTNYADGWLDTITFPTGGSMNVEYQSSAHYKHADGSLANPQLPIVIDTVKSVTINDGFGNPGTGGVPAKTSYFYSGGRWYYGGPYDRKFTGFERVDVTAADGDVTSTWYHLGNNDTTDYEQSDVYALGGRVWKTETRSSDGDLYQQSIIRYTTHQLQDTLELRAHYTHNDAAAVAITAEYTRTSVYPISRLTRQYDGGTSVTVQTAVGYEYDVGSGNLLSQINYGTVSTPLLQWIFGWDSNGTFNDAGDDARITQYTYAVNDVPPINLQHLGRMTAVATTELRDAADNRITRSELYYDGLVLGQLISGNTTKQRQLISGNAYTTMSAVYDQYGNPIAITDALNRTTIIAYDAQLFQFPYTVTNPSSQTTTYLYNTVCGNISYQRDANNNQSWYYTDNSCRLIRARATLQDATAVNTAFIVYSDIPNQVSIETIIRRNATDGTTMRTYLDGLGRAIETVVPLNHGASAVITGTEYNADGAAVRNLLPTESPSTSYQPVASLMLQNPGLVQMNTYDALNRPVSVTNSTGTTTNEYNGLRTVVTDAVGNKRGSIANAFGEIVKVQEYNVNAAGQPQLYTTTYNRDHRGLLTGITDALGNIRTFEYDGRGLMTRMTDLRATGDMTYGIWKFTYDLAGNKIKTTKPSNIVIENTYDALNRIIREKTYQAPVLQAPNGNSTATPGIVQSSALQTTYSYDTCPSGIGRLCKVTRTGGATQEYTYNTNGTQSSVTTTDNGNTSTESYTYNYQNQPLTITNSAGTITNTYRNSGLATQTTPDGMITTIRYHPSGAISDISKSTGHAQSYTYDTDRQNRLQSITHVTPNEPDTTQSYTYNAANIITGVTTDTTDTIYTYDSLYRLLSVTTNGVVTDTYTYNPIGNILTHNTTQYEYQASGQNQYANPHAATKIGDTPIIYNKNGDITKFGDRTLTWTYRGELSTYKQGATTYRYSYDTQGNRTNQRVYQSNTLQSQVFTPNDLLTIETANNQTIQRLNLTVNNLPTTTISTSLNTPSTTEHLYTNHLASVVATRGSITTNTTYSAFGSVTSAAPAVAADTNRGYIGEDLDSTGLSYLNARYYNSDMARFMSQDPVAVFSPERVLGDPQQLNTYSYAGNSPISYSDRSGLMRTESEQNALLNQQLNDIYGNEQLMNMIQGFGPGVVGSIEKAGVKGVRNVAQKVFRGDSRSPEEILQAGGFTSRGSNTDLLDHILDIKKDSAYIATSIDETIAQGHAVINAFKQNKTVTYVYEIMTKNLKTVDINKSLGNANIFSVEKEIGVINKIESSNISRVKQINIKKSPGSAKWKNFNK